ncbi:MAG TPA: hypothetical protein VMO26_28840 [Vicinamibacterales bacterium]|nr:hypothetical protein [Vicinamibacterales bacterium]
MATPDIDARIDRLYQLPLDEFTEARNALAKELKRPTIKDLDKPNIAAWAVNQLHWKERAAYNQLVQAAERLRAEHRKLLTGKPAGIRDAEKAHRDAIRAAAETIKDLLKDGGHALTEQTLAAVQETLEALPSDDHPGRLTRPLKRAGFEALAGIPVSALKGGPSTSLRTGPSTSSKAGLTLVKSPSDDKRARDEAKRREREDRERKERQREAEKALKTAEAAMLRAEEAVKKAEKALGELRAKRDEAVSEYQRARLRARE